MPTGCRSVYLSEVSVHASAPRGCSSKPAGDLECGAKDLGTHELCHLGERARLVKQEMAKRRREEEEMKQQHDEEGRGRMMEAALVRTTYSSGQTRFGSLELCSKLAGPSRVGVCARTEIEIQEKPMPKACLRRLLERRGAGTRKAGTGRVSEIDNDRPSSTADLQIAMSGTLGYVESWIPFADLTSRLLGRYGYGYEDN